jgi:hypothetical protein
MNEEATMQSSRDGQFGGTDSGAAAATVAEMKRKLELLESRFTMPLLPTVGEGGGGGGNNEASSRPAGAGGSPTATHGPEQSIPVATSLTTTAVPSIPVAFSQQALTTNSQHSFGFDAPVLYKNATCTSRCSHSATNTTTEHSKRVSSSPVASKAERDNGDGRTTPDWQTIAAQHMAKVAMEQQQQQELYNAHSQDRTLLTSHVVVMGSTTTAPTTTTTHSQLATKDNESNISLLQESPEPLSSLPLAIPIEATAMKAIYVRSNVFFICLYSYKYQSAHAPAVPIVVFL